MTKKFIGLNGYQWVWVLWLAVAVFTWQLKYFRHIDNNYLIFRQSYYHAVAQKNLYASYPKEYGDLYFYGPLFTIFVAPFAIPPHAIGFLLWCLGNALALLWAVHLLPFSDRKKMLILLFCAIEYANSVFYMQFNPMITAMILLSFIFVEKEKEEWSTMFTVLGAMMKLYPVVGLTFFLFSKHKTKFLVWTAIWSVVFFFLPMLISSPSFVLQCYHQWFPALNYKNGLNVDLHSSQDICLMGVVRRLTGNTTIPNLPFLIGGALLFVLPLLRFSQYKSFKFRLQVLTSALIAVVIFSTGAEHPTFVIAVTGAVIYIMMQDQPFSTLNITLLVLLLVFTGLSLTDAFPKPARDVMFRYSVKAWPCIIIWFRIVYELFFKDFTKPASATDTSGDPPLEYVISDC